MKPKPQKPLIVSASILLQSVILLSSRDQRMGGAYDGHVTIVKLTNHVSFDYCYSRQKINVGGRQRLCRRFV